MSDDLTDQPDVDTPPAQEGDDQVHEPADGEPGVPPEPGAGLGVEVEEPDPENDA